MKILGISLGHDSNFSLIQDGKVINVYEAERFYRKKRFKLQAFSGQKEILSGFQVVKESDLLETLLYLKNAWGSTYDHIAVQNQGRVEEFQELKKILKIINFSYDTIDNYAHHLCHASSSYFTSPFNDSLILSFDGAGNDGQTILFHAKNNKINYIKNYPIKFGQAYNNLGYIVGLSPDVAGSTAGKLMGLASYGNFRSEWAGYAKKYIKNYKKIVPKIKSRELNSYGKFHQINSKDFSNIDIFKKNKKNNNFILSFFEKFGLFYNPIRLGGDKDEDAQDLARTVQLVWTEEVLKIIKEFSHLSKNFCIVGGCALNGVTNYEIEKKNVFENIHYIPNPTDCGLSTGAALLSYYQKSNSTYNGYGSFFSPYLGDFAYDLKNINEYKNNYSYINLENSNIHQKIANAIYNNATIGVIRGRYEVGPRALGNRSILCNPTNPKMREILNQKVKNREWYRPFAPVSTIEESKKFFTNKNEIPYMSVICETRDSFRTIIPSVTHTDGSARLQTVSESSNNFLWKTINEFKKISNYPVLLNTSFNPGGEPILNFCKVGLSMLDQTELDFVLIDNTIFSIKKNKHELNSLFF